MADAQISIVAKAVDQASGTLNRVERSVNALQKSAGFAGRSFGKFNAVLQGIGIGVGMGSFYAIERAIGNLIGVIPDLIFKGKAWGDTVDAIGDVTGMTAEQSSELAAIQTMVGGTTDSLGKSLVILAKNAVTNKDAFDQLGIKTRNANGTLLDSYTIFQNVRRAVSEGGNSLLSTAAAAKVFGRGAGDLLDLLTLTNTQWEIYASEARKSGLILTEAGRNAAEQWQRTQNVLGAAISGLGSQILTNAAPALISLVNGITSAIHANMDNIVRFVVQVVNFIAGLIGGFLGIDFGLTTLSDKIDDAGKSADNTSKKFSQLGTSGKTASTGVDRLTLSLQRQIASIDRQLKLLDKSDRRQAARREFHQILADIADARKTLDDTKSQSIFFAGMSEAEGELARQAQANSIIEAEQKLADAKKKRREFERDQERQALRDSLMARRDALQQQLSDHQKALTSAVKANTTALKQIKATWSGKGKDSPLSGLTDAMKQAAADARIYGAQVAGAIMDALFGPKGPTTDVFGITLGGNRSGGLIEKIGQLVDIIGKLVDLLSAGAKSVGDVAGGVGDLFSALNGDPAASKRVSEWYLALVESVLDGISGLINGVLGQFGINLDIPSLSKPGGTGASYRTGGGSALNSQSLTTLTQLFRRYLGDGSPQLQAQVDALGALDWIRANTQTLPDGTLQTTLPDGTRINTKVTDWTAGQIPTAIQNWLATQTVRNDKFSDIGKVNNWNVNGAIKTAASDTFDYVKGTYNRLVSISAYTYWNGHGAATYLASINAVLQKKNPIIPAGSSAGAGAAGSASNPLHIKLSAPDLQRLARGQTVTSSLRPMTGT